MTTQRPAKRAAKKATPRKVVRTTKPNPAKRIETLEEQVKQLTWLHAELSNSYRQFALQVALVLSMVMPQQPQPQPQPGGPFSNNNGLSGLNPQTLQVLQAMQRMQSPGTPGV